MLTRFALLPTVALMLLSVAGCQEGSQHSAPSAPPPPGPQTTIGTIQGTVDGTTMTATFTPIVGAMSLSGQVSPSIYGNQGVTINVYGVVDSMITVAGTRRTWYIRVALRNLEAWPIGTNYPGAAPADSSGIFVFFSSLPVITIPSGCACSVTVFNPAGSSNFTAPGQPYFWYNNRPTAVQASPSTDTTKNNPEWQFRAPTFAGKDTAHAFTFVLLVKAAWPPPHETTWSATYDGTLDSLPDVNGKPLWRKFSVAQDPNPGSESWAAATQLLLTTPGANNSQYFRRFDSLGTMSAVMDVTARIASGGGGTYMAIFGFTEPTGGGRKQVFVGTNANRIGFVNFNNGSGAWGGVGISCPVATCGATNVNHLIRLRKFGRDSVVVCVDHTRRFVNTYGALQASDASFSPASAVFGSGHANTSSTWSGVSYTIGTDGGGC